MEVVRVGSCVIEFFALDSSLIDGSLHNILRYRKNRVFFIRLVEVCTGEPRFLEVRRSAIAVSKCGSVDTDGALGHFLPRNEWNYLFPHSVQR